MPPNPVCPIVLHAKNAQHTAHRLTPKHGGHTDVAHVEAQSIATVSCTRAARHGCHAASALYHQKAHRPLANPRDNDAGAAYSEEIVSRRVLDPIQPRGAMVSLRRTYNLPPLSPAPQRRAVRQVRPNCDRHDVVVSELLALGQSLEATLLMKDSHSRTGTVPTEPGGTVFTGCGSSGRRGHRRPFVGTARCCWRGTECMTSRQTCLGFLIIRSDRVVRGAVFIVRYCPVQDVRDLLGHEQLQGML